jgi:glycosyltransferase involved in cell wall biosynthesis
MIEDITPLILTYNEAPNLRRTLASLAWAKEILVVDSFSTDETLTIARDFPQVRVVQRKFDSFAGQCNFGLQQVQTDWVLSLDADYVLTPELVTEIKSLSPPTEVAGYATGFRYCVNGHPLRACLYPPRTVLYQRRLANYQNDGHGHRVQMAGKISRLAGYIDHDDRKPLSHWLWAQDRYAILEAAKLLGSKEPGAGTALNWPDRVRKKIILAPALVFFYTLLVKGLILDGWPGWYYVLQRTFAELLLSLRLLEEKLKIETKS